MRKYWLILVCRAYFYCNDRLEKENIPREYAKIHKPWSAYAKPPKNQIQRATIVADAQ